MPIRPLQGLAVFAVVALIGNAVIQIVAAVVDLWYASLVDRMVADPDSVTAAEIDTGDLVWGLSGIAETALFLVAIVAFLVWLFRVRANAEVLAPGHHRRGKPWLIFGWVVPIVNLWFPKQIVDDIWSASSRVARSPRGLFHAWWAAWLIGVWGARVASRLLLRADDLQTIADAARFDAISNVLMLIAAVLAIGIIRKITTAQEGHRSAAAGMPLDGMAAGAPEGSLPR